MTASRHPASVMAAIAAPGDGLCLDFVNTRYWRGSAVPTDELTGFQPLHGWLKEKGGHEEKTLDAAGAWAAKAPAKAGELFGEAIALRETIHRLFAAAASEAALPVADFDALNATLAIAPARGRLASPDGGWEVCLPGVSVSALLAPVLWSAADLLLSRKDRRIRQCANEKCRFLFIDESKNGTRRWCDMSSCGNRAKAHRHLMKKKQG
ncbi:CGNR zinc finger domain-containing protein [Neomesorhizobium albiziae]|nr:ABATE domain-containing protein [Mesorhizobium albiziae]